jgi:GNAT superfamily N-acetyltransferase
MTQVHVSPLDPAEIEDALVLASLCALDLDSEAWKRATAERLAAPGEGGVLIARCDTGRACGLLHYDILPRGEGRACLKIEALVAFDLTRPRGVAEALVAEAVQQGRRRGCDRLELCQPLDEGRSASDLVLASKVARLHSVF